MKILGIDPGLATTGYGLIQRNGSRVNALDYGSIVTAKQQDPAKRLASLYQHLTDLISQSKPDVACVEKLFFNTNTTTGIVVSQARGVILLAIEHANIPIIEYTPLQVKMSVCGYGAAKKPQVQQMVQALLKLQNIPKPDDAADALAIALCYTPASHQESALKNTRLNLGGTTA